MTEREHVLSMWVAFARWHAADRSITDQATLETFLADYAARTSPAGAGPARDDHPSYAYGAHRRGVWVGRMAHMHEGPPAIRWSEVAALALGAPRQAVLL